MARRKNKSKVDGIKGRFETRGREGVALTRESPHVFHEELLYHNEPQPLAKDEIHLLCKGRKTAAK